MSQINVTDSTPWGRAIDRQRAPAGEERGPGRLSDALPLTIKQQAAHRVVCLVVKTTPNDDKDDSR